jgi:hypothetical protein
MPCGSSQCPKGTSTRSAPAQWIEVDFASVAIAAKDQQGCRIVPGWMIGNPIIADLHSVHDGQFERSATLDHAPTHREKMKTEKKARVSRYFLPVRNVSKMRPSGKFGGVCSRRTVRRDDTTAEVAQPRHRPPDLGNNGSGPLGAVPCVRVQCEA